jgi:hypothetical protein
MMMLMIRTFWMGLLHHHSNNNSNNKRHLVLVPVLNEPCPNDGVLGVRSIDGRL